MIFVTGGTGLVGSNIVKLYSDWYGLDVVYLSRHPPQKSFPGKWARGDMCVPTEVRDILRTHSPEVIIHTAILNDDALMNRDRRLAWDSYVGATRTLVDAANEIGATFVYISSDWVFDGTQPESQEDTPPNPVNLYGVLKLCSELVTLERARQPIIARVSGVNGLEWAREAASREQDAGFGYFVAALVDTLSAGRPFSVWESDHINNRATPSLASESAEMILRLIRAKARGIFHCCGGEHATRAELALAAAEAFGLDSSLIRRGPPVGIDPSERVPFDTSLNSSATASLIDYDRPTIVELLNGFRQQRETAEVRPIGRA
jgi:dTDP-4-dehydrorhamnose reductase